jgi:hypothetical protein
MEESLAQDSIPIRRSRAPRRRRPPRRGNSTPEPPRAGASVTLASCTQPTAPLRPPQTANAHIGEAAVLQLEKTGGRRGKNVEVSLPCADRPGGPHWTSRSPSRSPFHCPGPGAPILDRHHPSYSATDAHHLTRTHTDAIRGTNAGPIRYSRWLGVAELAVSGVLTSGSNAQPPGRAESGLTSGRSGRSAG